MPKLCNPTDRDVRCDFLNVTVAARGSVRITAEQADVARKLALLTVEEDASSSAEKISDGSHDEVR